MYHELTENDIKKMEEEIEYRKVVVRKERLEAVKEARAQGDLSENFEYYAAKREKNKNESRIRYLEREIRTAKIIEDTASEDEVGLFNTVTLFYEDEDEEETVKLVTSLRVDATAGKISNVSPIGKAIMGHKVGDRVYVEISTRAKRIWPLLPGGLHHSLLLSARHRHLQRRGALHRPIPRRHRPPTPTPALRHDPDSQPRTITHSHSLRHAADHKNPHPL